MVQPQEAEPRPQDVRRCVAWFRDGRAQTVTGTRQGFRDKWTSLGMPQAQAGKRRRPDQADTDPPAGRKGRNDRMLGLMQDWPLLIHTVIDHAASQHGAREVVSRSVEGPIHRIGYAELRRRALQAAKRLERQGIRLGRPGRHAGLEHLAAPGDLVRHHRHRRDLPHGQSAPVPRPDRLHHQSRRGPDALPRPHLRPAGGVDGRPAALRRALRRPHRRRAHAGDDPARRGGL